jgi:uncharacterized protein (TIGR02145 family)
VCCLVTVFFFGCGGQGSDGKDNTEDAGDDLIVDSDSSSTDGDNGTDTFETEETPLDLGLTDPPITGSFTDSRDGKSYEWVEINGVKWMAENLDFEPEEGALVTCFYDWETETENCDTYGRFYGWSAMHDLPRIGDEALVGIPENAMVRGICPEGWRLPLCQEWVDLFTWVNELAGFEEPYDGFSTISWPGIGAPFRSAEEWEGSATSTNELGFNAKPYTESGAHSFTSFWGGDELGSESGPIVEFYSSNAVYIERDTKAMRHAVRCIEGAPTIANPVIEFATPGNDTDVFTDDRDGEVYHYTQIGDQVWMAENLNYLPDSGVSNCYSFQEDHCRLFGRLYGFETAQTVCPGGWHLPTIEEWQTLGDFVDTELGGSGRLGSEENPVWDIGEALMGVDGWRWPPDQAGSFGFFALPGGFHLDGGPGGSLATEAVFWSASLDNETTFQIDQWSASTLAQFPVRAGLEGSVRCIRD